MSDDVPILFDFPDVAGPERGDSIAHVPVVPLINVVIFPHMLAPLFVGRERSIAAVEAALATDKRIIAVAQRAPELNAVEPADLYTIGVEAEVQRALKLPDGSTSVVVHGLRRVRVTGYSQTGGVLWAAAEPLLSVQAEQTLTTHALRRTVLALFERIVRLSRTLTADSYAMAEQVADPGWLADLVGALLPLGIAQRQELLEQDSLTLRLERLAVFLGQELDVLELEARIQSHVQHEVDRTQREFYLREQLKVIQRELGHEDAAHRDAANLRERVIALDAPKPVRQRAHEELDRLEQIAPASPEHTIARTYLDWLLALPWTQRTADSTSLAAAAALLDQSHYGLDKTKERILEFLAVRQLAGAHHKAPILCLVGPPGVGKTSLGHGVTAALGRTFVRVSLGGVRDEAEIRGHRRTYIGAMPGRIIKALRDAKVVNPVFVLDEIDKLGTDFRGDPAAALLEVLDPEQNHTFSDHYLDLPYDLSEVLFIATANTLETIPAALLDRMEVIGLDGYTEEEKVQIARRFLVPKQLVACGLIAQPEHTVLPLPPAHAPHTPPIPPVVLAGHPMQQRNGGAATTLTLPSAATARPLRFGDTALKTIIRDYTREAGVRGLEREIGAVCRKIARRVAEGREHAQVVTPTLLRRYLGPPRQTHGKIDTASAVGAVLGMTWTPVGGDIVLVEVTVMEGRGRLLLTGRLGEVMRESAQTALSYARANADALGIAQRRFERLDLHVHVPEGAVAKDGPSAGVTVAVALVSALAGRAARHDLALTGEITLRGRVLAVGGVKEKVLGAHRAGVTAVVLPRANAADLEQLPAAVRRDLRITLVETVEQALALALLD